VPAPRRKLSRARTDAVKTRNGIEKLEMLHGRPRWRTSVRERRDIE
jgi:hypothetical protein